MYLYAIFCPLTCHFHPLACHFRVVCRNVLLFRRFCPAFCFRQVGKYDSSCSWLFANSLRARSGLPRPQYQRCVLVRIAITAKCTDDILLHIELTVTIQDWALQLTETFRWLLLPSSLFCQYLATDLWKSGLRPTSCDPTSEDNLHRNWPYLHWDTWRVIQKMGHN